MGEAPFFFFFPEGARALRCSLRMSRETGTKVWKKRAVRKADLGSLGNWAEFMSDSMRYEDWEDAARSSLRPSSTGRFFEIIPAVVPMNVTI